MKPHAILARLIKVAVFLLLACPPPETPVFGERPVGLFAFGNMGILATEVATDSYHLGEFHYYRVLSDGTIEVLFTESTRAKIRENNIVFAAGGTDTSEGDVLFLVSGIADENVLVTRITKGESKSHPLNIVELGNDVAISVLRRDKDRQWVWVSSRSGFEEPEKLPLMEFEGDKMTVLASNVMWVHCNLRWCQQLRSEEGMIRLYASPSTSDSYLRPVSEAPAPQLLETAPTLLSTRHHRTCNMNATTQVVRLDALYYFVSVTEPALAAMPLSEAVNKYPTFSRDCPAIEADFEKPDLDQRRGFKSKLRWPTPRPVQFDDKTDLSTRAVRSETRIPTECPDYNPLANNCKEDAVKFSTLLHFRNSDRDIQYYVHEPL